MPGAVQGFRRFNEQFECVVLTARAESARQLTEAWLRRHLGAVPALYMRPHWRETSAQFKVRMVGELRPRAHFEDDPFTAGWVAELVPDVFLVDWRRNRWLSGPNIHRVQLLTGAAPLLEGALGTRHPELGTP
jgi:hypothetical protein